MYKSSMYHLKLHFQKQKKKQGFIGGQVPTFELVFFLTMEAFGKVHPNQRIYSQWKQMSQRERDLQINDMAEVYLETARRYGHSAIHSLDPQGGVSIPEVRKLIGDDICLIGNVNCGLLQTGTDEECKADVMRSLGEGMAKGRGYVFATSNCAYTGLPLERYEMMIDLWRKYGNYDRQQETA